MTLFVVDVDQPIESCQWIFDVCYSDSVFIMKKWGCFGQVLGKYMNHGLLALSRTPIYNLSRLNIDMIYVHLGQP
uniref:RNA-directed DNA polymerase, eukaryota, reverse transcriptase zinc-binding domain protein n=1 Tax=Steinernema glaseri TaxID=37863 RepID=A0A1I7XWQ4_9BILA